MLIPSAPDADMDLAAHAIKHVVYPLWVLKNGSSRLQYLAQLEKSQYWSKETLIEHQWTSLRQLVTHAFETCPYYRKKFHEAGITPADVRSQEDIQRVPTITKEEIQEHRDEMISTQSHKDSLIQDMTGGSTGSPMQFYYDKDRLDSRAAATLRHDRWAGWDIGDRVAILWGAPQDTKISGNLKDRIRERVIARRLILDASSLDEASMFEFAQKLIRFQPTVLLAYANTLGLFARYLKAEKIKGIAPKGIICSAEVLTDENRRLIEQVFGCPVYNRYGSREYAVIASECSMHAGMHINAENLLVEVLADARPCLEEEGEIVITDLKNFAMPLIRYRIKDFGRLKDKSCECSRGLPLIELSGGRVTDFLTATNCKKVSGIVVATYVITNIPGIRQIQFVQSKLGSVTINLVKGPDWSLQTQESLVGRAREFLGTDMQIEIICRDNIPLEKSGKYRFSISTLPI